MIRCLNWNAVLLQNKLRLKCQTLIKFVCGKTVSKMSNGQRKQSLTITTISMCQESKIERHFRKTKYCVHNFSTSLKNTCKFERMSWTKQTVYSYIKCSIVSVWELKLCLNKEKAFLLSVGPSIKYLITIISYIL